MKTISYRDGLREALHEEMARDDSVFVIGEDVIIHGGPYAVTQGIEERFPGRIFETPIAEAGIVGVGVGAAMAGMRPVVELMYLDFVTCAMDEVVNLALAELTYQLHSIDATVDIADRLPVVLADETRMGQVWRNLIGNAVKYRDPNRRLHIKIGVDEKPGGGWALHISDTGIGIPEDQLRKVFDLYHRVDEKRKADSTGLGLAMVKRIVEQHSGEVWVISRVGEGSTFTFTLPHCQPGEAS